MNENEGNVKIRRCAGPRGVPPFSGRRNIAGERGLIENAHDRPEPMPRFFFEIADQTQFTRDEEGIEFPDSDAALEEMMSCLQEMIGREAGGEAKVIATLRDERGRTLARGSASLGLHLPPLRASVGKAGSCFPVTNLDEIVEEGRTLRAKLRAQREKAARIKAEIQHLREQIAEDRVALRLQRAHASRGGGRFEALGRAAGQQP